MKIDPSNKLLEFKWWWSKSEYSPSLTGSF